MYIQPAEYLDLTERISILSKKYEQICLQKNEARNKALALQQKIRLLQLQVSQLTKQKQQQKQGLRQHVSLKADNIIQLINSTKQNEKGLIEQKINKVKNWSAINVLKQLEQRIIQNRTITFEKDFYEKVKTLYIIDKKKVKCTFQELLKWVKQLVNKCNAITDPLGINQSNRILGTQKSVTSMKKSQSGIKNTKRQSKKQGKLVDRSNIERGTVTIKQQSLILNRQNKLSSTSKIQPQQTYQSNPIQQISHNQALQLQRLSQQLELGI